MLERFFNSENMSKEKARIIQFFLALFHVTSLISVPLLYSFVEGSSICAQHQGLKLIFAVAIFLIFFFNVFSIEIWIETSLTLKK